MKIKAAVFERPGEVPGFSALELAGLAPHEVLVKIRATGICHTDLKMADASTAPRPVVLGHEGAGVIEEVGSAVTSVAPGDHVVLTFASCGSCPSCHEAEPAYCHEMVPRNFGCSPALGRDYLFRNGKPVAGAFFGQSSFATHAIATERNVVKVRDDAPLELLGPFGCGIQTGAGAVLNDLQVSPGQSIAIFGVGSLGLSAVMAAKLVGAGQIIVVDRHQHRLDLARELGADEALVGGDASVEQIRRIARGGVNCSLDTTGALLVMRQAVDVLAPRGECGFVTGPWSGEPLEVPVRDLLYGRKIRGISQGNSNPAVFIPRLVDLYMKGRFPVDRLVSFYEAEEIKNAFADTASGKAIKPILRFG